METVIELANADIPRAATASPVPVVKDVRWEIRAGEFWVLGALPGGGKTDLLCTAAGLQRPMKGRQRLFGKDTETLSEEELVAARLRIAMVFTSGRLFHGLTVAQNVALPISYHYSYDVEEVSRKVSEALALTGLTEWEHQRPTQITRNLHQRIGLARALALEPEILLVDNPLTGIDPRQGRWWLDFLCTAGKTKTIIVAVDDLRPWLEVGTQFALLRKRHFEVLGGRGHVQNSSDPLVRELLMPAFDDE